ncbi:MAG TPA: SAM-dependent methyltransferase, partial [Actinomycetota bacterium]|nr:SAM-dependent methyltransferase [Actinomycetota bacterium]
LDSVIVDVARHDSIRQHVMNQHVLISGGRAELYPVLIRYAWPSELDLMARLAGLELQERWAGWRREPFLPSSTMHVSVYRKKVEPDR